MFSIYIVLLVAMTKRKLEHEIYCYEELELEREILLKPNLSMESSTLVCGGRRYRAGRCALR